MDAGLTWGLALAVGDGFQRTGAATLQKIRNRHVNEHASHILQTHANAAPRLNYLAAIHVGAHLISGLRLAGLVHSAP